MSRITTLALALAAVLVLAACTAQEPEITLDDQVPADLRQDETVEQEQEPVAEEDVVVYEAYDLGFNGPTELPAGNVTIRMDNTGNLPHDITIEELGDAEVVFADGGESDQATVTLDPGTYTFYCSVPGHRNAMEMTVEVTG